MKDNRYYIYEWVRLDTNEPFYVGKGSGRRAYISTRSKNKHFNNIVKNTPVAVHILHDNLTEEEAYKYESWYIYEYRDIIGYDLCNIADGGEHPPSYKGENNPASRSVKLYNLEGKLLKEYNTMTEAQLDTGISRRNIGKCCEKQYTHYKNTIWTYSEDEFILPKKMKFIRRVIQKDKDGNILNIYDNCNVASKILGLNRRSIARACNKERNTYHDYIWEWEV